MLLFLFLHCRKSIEKAATMTLLNLSSSLATRGFPQRVDPLRSGRRGGEVAERAAVSGLSQHPAADLRLPAATDLRPVS